VKHFSFVIFSYLFIASTVCVIAQDSKALKKWKVISVYAIGNGKNDNDPPRILAIWIKGFKSGEIRLTEFDSTNDPTQTLIFKDSVIEDRLDFPKGHGWDDPSGTMLSMHHSSNMAFINFDKVIADSIHIKTNLRSSDDGSIHFANCQISNFTNYNSRNIYFTQSFIKTIENFDSDSLHLLGESPNLKRLYISGSTIWYLGFPTDTLILNRCILKNVNLNPTKSIGGITILGLDDSIDLSESIFDMQFFKFDGNLTALSHDQSITILNTIKDVQKKHHFEKGYEIADKELMKFQYLNLPIRSDFLSLGRIRNWISEWWWDYGYDKGKVVVNSLYLMLVFFIINLFFFKGLLTTYPIKSLVEAERTNRTFYVRHEGIRYIKSFFYCFFYTGTLFWGIKFDFEKVSVEKIGLVILVIIEYTTGIVCLANYIIVR